MPLAKKACFGIVFVLTASVLLLLGLEGLGRWIVHVRYGRPGKVYGIWMADPELGAVHRPNSYNSQTSINDYGFRDRENVFQPKPSNGLRILVFGGSTSFGYNLSDDQTYPYQLEQRLRALPGYERTQVLNAGRICACAGYNLILIKRMIPLLQPDYVILYEGVNEEMNAAMLRREGISLNGPGSHGGLIGKGYTQDQWLMQHSVLMRWLDYWRASRLPHIPAGQPDPDRPGFHDRVDPWAVENYKGVLAEILDFLRARRVPVIVVRYASFGVWDQTVFSDLSAAIARQHGVAVYDMESRFNELKDRKKDYFIYTGVHVTPAGATIVANDLAQILQQGRKRSATALRSG